jgi:hypothetical protein
MPSTAHPPARPRDARDNRAQFPAFLQTLLAILATILGRPRALSRAWHPMPLPAAEHPQYDLPDAEDAYDGWYGLPYDGTHMTLEHPMLYVIGPGPNRGLRPLPRKTPLAPPRLARPPPHPAQKSPPTRDADACPKCCDYAIILPAPGAFAQPVSGNHRKKEVLF